MISVIIPVFNMQEYLADCIESALDQFVKPYEIVIVNDGSTDKSLEIAKKYETMSQKIKVISQVNKGLASARNTGIMNTIGDWILPLDADDMLEDNAIEIIEKSFGDDCEIIAPSFKEFGIRNQEVILMDNPTLEDFKTGNRIGYFSAIRRRNLIEVGGYNPKMIWGWEDYDLWFDLLKNGARIKTLKEPLILYRTKEQSMITEANKHSEELWTQIIKNHPEVWTNSPI